MFSNYVLFSVQFYRWTRDFIQSFFTTEYYSDTEDDLSFEDDFNLNPEYKTKFENLLLEDDHL